MSTPQIEVRTADGRRRLDVTPPEALLTLSELLRQRGLPLNTRCGGRGACGGCEVELHAGLLCRAGDGATAGPEDGPRFKACQMRPGPGTAELSVPNRSLLRHEPSVLAEFRLNIPWARDPLGPPARYGAAVDVGTTTVALLLCDLGNGAVVGQASAFNAQIRYGEDVITRIQHCTGSAEALGQLQRAVAAETIAPLLGEACASAGVSPGEVGVMAVAGNTTMLHLLAGVDPTPMGVHPFRPAFLGHRIHHPGELGLAFGDKGAQVHLLPGPAAYVGSDLAAGLVATGMIYEEGPALLIDVGTNGEIIAKVGDRLLGCATAAGPAFEGAGLTSGTRATRGAIERIRLWDDPFSVELGLIGGGRNPQGICGSAYVDFLWEARRLGFLLPSGRFSPAFFDSAGDHLESDAYGHRLRLTSRGSPGPAWISELDIAKLLQAKAAIAAGTSTLLHLLGRAPGDFRKVYLAGGFGFHLSLEHAIGCGLLSGFAQGQIEVVGNTSLGGAFLALNDRSLLGEMAEASRRMETVELNLQPGFEDAYIDHLILG